MSTLALIALLAFNACGEGQQTPPIEADNPATQPEQEIIDEEPIEEDEEPVDEDEDVIGSDYVGTWSRISSTLNGEPQDVIPSTIIMTKDTYTSSTSVCTISGDLFATDETMDIIINSSDCPGEISTDYVNAYAISEDGEILTLTNTQFGGTMVEVYERVE